MLQVGDVYCPSRRMRILQKRYDIEGGGVNGSATIMKYNIIN